MTAGDLQLLLDQTALTEKAQAIAMGRVAIDRDHLVELLRSELTRDGVWRDDLDSNVLGRYARGELTAGDVSEYFRGRL